MSVQAVLLCAGSGTRFKSAIPKPLVLLNGKPIFLYSLELFERCADIKSVILVGPKKSLSAFEKVVRKSKLKKVGRIIPGGAQRCDSVRAALKVLAPETRLVLIHDGARPLVTEKMIRELIAAARKSGSAIAAVPVKPTIKIIDNRTMTVRRTLDRRSLWEIQTPQVFRRDIIVKAHRSARSNRATDDAMMVEHLGIRVKIVAGDYRNIKITTPEDLALASILSRSGRKRKE